MRPVPTAPAASHPVHQDSPSVTETLRMAARLLTMPAPARQHVAMLIVAVVRQIVRDVGADSLQPLAYA
jgi:hypothetical protein